MEQQWSHQPSYPVLQQPRQDDFLSDFKSMGMNSPTLQRMQQPQQSNMNPMNHALDQVPANQPGSNTVVVDADALQQLTKGFTKMMSMMEKLEQRMQRVEQTVSIVLKNQQETFQVPFMSQSEIDKARQAAELLERDSSVAKQLQAAYNKEVEVRKHFVAVSNTLVECPICGVRVNGGDIEVHVDQCLEMFSNDPKKEVQIQDAKKKMDQGFFSRFMKTAKKTETTSTTKVTTTTSSNSGKNEASAPLLGGDRDSMMMNGYYGPQFGYPPPPHFGHNGGQPSPMMMPMYMYPSYPSTHMTTQLQE